MTEKRFSIKAGSSIGLSSIYTDNGKVMTQLEVLDVLINQHETIGELKQTIHRLGENIDELMQLDVEEELLKENEQLKKENRKLKEDLEHCANQFTNDGKNVLLSLR